jgi:phage terminase large subunit
MKPRAEFPKKLQPLFQPCRYKVLYGGRGGAKSWAIARALLIMGAQRPLRILCARELQKSIKDSVHKLLADQISNLQLDSKYEVQQATIKGTNGTEFFFEGLRHNSNQIKSYEGVDICWIEEAQTTSRSSWRYLIPTIRKEGSEIWISFNPELEEDETYQRFVVNPPEESVIMPVSWRDNPWFTDVLKKELEHDKERNYAEYLVTWEGHCRVAVEGAIFEDELRVANTETRITSVPCDTTKPVNTFWDLGHGDQTAIWFIQKIGFEYHIIDFYQNARKKIQHYMQVLQEKGYIYGTDYLPHDGTSNHLTGSSVEETMVSLGRRVEIVPRIQAKTDAINAARTVFPMCYFDSERCQEGLQSLKRYRYDVDTDTGKVSKNPLHDIYSDGADAFQTFATAPHIMWEAYTGEIKGISHKADYNPYAEDRL